MRLSAGERPERDRHATPTSWHPWCGSARAAEADGAPSELTEVAGTGYTLTMNQPSSIGSLSPLESILESDLPEQEYQACLEHEPRLIPREFVQNHGIHFQLLLRKLRLGGDFATDFCYLSKSSDDWNIVLVEIEKPRSRFFSGDRFHGDFRVALEQVNTWRSWFSERANLSYLADSVLGLVRRPLAKNPCHIKYVLVMGRRQEYAASDYLRRRVAAEERDDFKILTYDSLLEDQDSKRELYVGTLRAGGLDILSSRYVDDSLFAYVPPEQLRITPSLRKDVLANRHRWRTVSPQSLSTYILDERLPRIGVLP